jgi:hypothetical protein
MVERMLIIMLLKLESNRCFLVKNVECKMQSLVGTRMGLVWKSLISFHARFNHSRKVEKLWPFILISL